MNERFSAGMTEATRLTGAGKLAEAAALIQRLLSGEDAGTTPHPTHTGSPTIIDVEPITVEPADAQPSHPKPSHQDAKPASAATFGGTLHAKPQTGLGETLRNLAARAMPAGLDLGIGDLARPAAAPLPDGASFVTASYSNEAGMRSYMLYTPSKRAGGPLPLIIMLHGCTQSPDDFAAGTRMNALAEEVGCLVAYPAQPSSANAQKCWNWFSLDDQQRDRGEPSLIAGITRQIMRDHPVDPSRVYVAGLSAGGSAAVIMAAAYPDLYGAIGVHSGLPSGAARDLPSAFAAMNQGAAGTGHARVVPTIVFHGDRDGTVHPSTGGAVVTQSVASATGVRATTQRGQVPSGRGYSRTVHSDPAGRALCEHWVIEGGGHAWAGGSPAGSYTDPRGPDASREMLRFFLENPHRDQRPVN